MIRIYFYRKGEHCRLFATGHAEADAERDAVCAGVSALTSALVLCALAEPGCKHLRYSMEPGEVFFSCRGLREGFTLVQRGLLAIAKSHPDHVRIESNIIVDDKIE